MVSLRFAAAIVHLKSRMWREKEKGEACAQRRGTGMGVDIGCGVRSPS